MSDYDEGELLRLAAQAAQAGAAELVPRFGQRPNGVRTKSSPTDLVSEADEAAESAIRALLSDRRPGDAILGEEAGATGGGGHSGLRWLVDPLDGTINFLFGIPAFAVSVGCEHRSGPLVGVVLDPIRRERFSATRGGPPELNGEPLASSSRAERLELAMVATGFAYEASLRARQADVLARVLPRVRDIRRIGAASLDLAWSACGRFDAYYERGLKPWDLAAGALIASRAGLELRELPAVGEDPAGLVAAPPSLIDELAELVGG